MPESYAIWAPTLLCATCRVAGLLLVAPAAGHAAVPVRLRNTEWVVFTSAGALRALPPGVEASPIRTPKLTLYKLHCDPGVPLVIGPGLRLQCSPR